MYIYYNINLKKVYGWNGLSAINYAFRVFKFIKKKLSTVITK